MDVNESRHQYINMNVTESATRRTYDASRKIGRLARPSDAARARQPSDWRNNCRPMPPPLQHPDTLICFIQCVRPLTASSRGDFGGANGAALPPAILSSAGDPIFLAPAKPATTLTCRHTTRRHRPATSPLPPWLI
jgi:hypothetical protein